MTRRGFMLFALLSLPWGIPYLMIKVAINEISVPFLVFARSAIGAVALLPIALVERGLGRLSGRWPAILGFCLIEMVAPWGLIAHGEISIDSSTAGLLIALTPIVTVVLSSLTGMESRSAGGGGLACPASRLCRCLCSGRSNHGRGLAGFHGIPSGPGGRDCRRSDRDRRAQLLLCEARRERAAASRQEQQALGKSLLFKVNRIYSNLHAIYAHLTHDNPPHDRARAWE